MAIRCRGCGASVPDENGPDGGYLESAPGCWRIYGEVQARYGEPGLTWRTQKIAADAYAVQHPGRPGRQSSQSVVTHLLSLHLVLEQHTAPEYATRVMAQAIDAMRGRFPWLDPPTTRGEITVIDVWHAIELEPAVQQWAQAAWRAWAHHHDYIHSLPGIGHR